MTVIEYLNKKGLQYNQKGNQLNMNCPFCSDKEYKFYISADKGLYKCYHENKCGAKGNFKQFQENLGDKPKIQVNDNYFETKKKNYKKPPEIKSVKHPNQEFIDFFHKRGIENKTISRYKIQIVDNYWIVFQYFKSGEVVNRKYRTLDKKFKQEQEAEPCLYGQDLISDTAKEIIICEGEFDCMIWDQLGYSVVSIPSGVNNLDWIENDYEFLQRFSKIFLSMDMDKAGRDAVEKIVPRLGKWRCYDLQLPHKDINDCILNGLSQIEIDQFFDNANGYDLPSLKSAEYFADEVIELFEHPELLEGDNIGYERLNELLHGWRPGELTIWTGKNGSGKSTFVNQCLIKQIVNNQKKVCIGSFELPAKRFLNWIFKSLIDGDKIAPDKVANEIRKFLKQIGPFLYIIDIVGEIKKESLIEIMEFAAKKYGIDHFLIDSMMRINMPHYNELSEQKNLISELKSFTMEYGVHTHLITHPRKTQNDDDIIGQSDVSGTGSITDLADNVIVNHRFSEKQIKKLSVDNSFYSDVSNALFVTKCREHGDQGKVYLRFDKKKKMFSEKIIVNNYGDDF